MGSLATVRVLVLKEGLENTCLLLGWCKYACRHDGEKDGAKMTTGGGDGKDTISVYDI